SSGALLWAKSTEFGGAMYMGVSIDNRHNIYAVGLFRDSVRFPGGISLKNPYHNSQIHAAHFFVKFDSSRNALWAEYITYMMSQSLTTNPKITIDSSGNPIMSFEFQYDVMIGDSLLQVKSLCDLG